MDKITRDHTRKFYQWWDDRIHPKGNSTQASSKSYRPNSANRELRNLRKTFREYWSYQGEENPENPFRNLRFKDKAREPKPAFSGAWVREKLLK